MNMKEMRDVLCLLTRKQVRDMNCVFLIALLCLFVVRCPTSGQNAVNQAIECSTECPAGKRCIKDNTTILWELYSRNECKSYRTCYGQSSDYPDDTTTDIFAGRFYPEVIALGSTVYFKAKYTQSDILKPFTIYNVSQANFLGCNNATDFVGTLTTAVKLPDSYISTVGYKYFIAMARGHYLTCNFGLRLHLNVKEATNCSGVSMLPPGGKLCSGAGRCVSKSFTGGMYCVCCPGYSGEFCEELNSCYAKPCQRGNCSDIIAGLNDSYNCTCEVGYTGHDCDINVDECKVYNVVCQNGGFCLDGVASYECLCFPGFHGKHCELASNICDSIKPCKNSGVCSRVGNRRESYVCLCPSGFYGRNCTLNVTISSLAPYMSSILKTSFHHTNKVSFWQSSTKTLLITATAHSINATMLASQLYSRKKLYSASELSNIQPNVVSMTTSVEPLTMSLPPTVKITSLPTPSYNSLSLITPSMVTSFIPRPNSNTDTSILGTRNPVSPWQPSTMISPWQPSTAISLQRPSTIISPWQLSTMISPSTTSMVATSSVIPVRVPLENQTCSDNPCGDHGVCTNVSSSGLSFSCHCQYPAVGPVCTTDLELHFPYFSGNSFIEFKPITFGSSMNEFIISFRTQRDGTLLYSGQRTFRDFIKLEVFQGFLKFSLDAGDKLVSITSRENVAHGNTTAASFGYDTRTGSVFMSVNNGVEQRVTTRGQLRDVQLFHPLYLGGIVPSIYTQNNPNVGVLTPFIGCVRELEFNDRSIELSDAVNWQNISECDLPACKAKPCENGAVCAQDHENINEYSCECVYPYSGKNCEEKYACEVNVCNGGKCLNTSSSGVECFCQFGRAGVSCNQDIDISIPTFNVVKNHSSYLQYITPRDAVHQLDLRMEIKFADNVSSRRGGLLFYVGLHDHLSAGSDGDYLALGIQNNRVLLQFNLGSGTVNITSDELNYAQEWFTILAGRKGRHGYLYIDTKVKEASSPLPLVALNVFGHLYLGGLPLFTMLNSEVTYTEGFRGSIKDAKIRTGLSNSWISLSTQHSTNLSSTVAVVSGLNVQDQRVNACDVDACMNNGSCQSLGASYVCRCLPMYSGMTCNDTAVPCRDYNPCGYLSSCRMLESGFTCDCPPGKAGKYCHNDVNITTPHFGEYSYLSFSLAKIKIHSQTSITLGFLTSAANGILFYITHDITSLSGDFMSVTLHDKHVYLIYNLGTGIAKCRSENAILIDRKNNITVSRNGITSKLLLNSNETSCSSFGGATQLNVASVFYLGGVPDLAQVQPLAYENSRDLRDFSGCVQHLTINGHSFDLSQRVALDGRNIVNCDSKRMQV